MGAFLRILLTVVLFFYAFSMLIKLIFRRKMRKLEKQMNQYAQEEYTDYEEIK